MRIETWRLAHAAGDALVGEIDLYIGTGSRVVVAGGSARR